MACHRHGSSWGSMCERCWGEAVGQLLESFSRCHVRLPPVFISAQQAPSELQHSGGTFLYALYIFWMSSFHPAITGDLMSKTFHLTESLWGAFNTTAAEDPVRTCQPCQVHGDWSSCLHWYVSCFLSTYKFHSMISLACFSIFQQHYGRFGAASSKACQEKQSMFTFAIELLWIWVLKLSECQFHNPAMVTDCCIVF